MKRRNSSQLWEITTVSSASITRLSSQVGKCAAAPLWACAMSLVVACANTMHSTSELLASRLAPCRPLQAD